MEVNLTVNLSSVYTFNFYVVGIGMVFVDRKRSIEESSVNLI